MSSTTISYDINLDTPINLLTPRQLFQMMGEWQAKNNTPTEQAQSPERWVVNSVPELAKILGTSVSTIYRMKASGQLDDCISQYGKWTLIDVQAVMDKFRLSNRKKKRGS